VAALSRIRIRTDYYQTGSRSHSRISRARSITLQCFPGRRCSALRTTPRPFAPRTATKNLPPLHLARPPYLVRRKGNPPPCIAPVFFSPNHVSAICR
jgi:hypothetical protein